MSRLNIRPEATAVRGSIQELYAFNVSVSISQFCDKRFFH